MLEIFLPITLLDEIYSIVNLPRPVNDKTTKYTIFKDNNS